ncbi:MAG TPA: Ig-like domain-containing protein, partial [Candidatus Acidoferrales bacterium]|nr:Ig-like domain-containing protein [Candidatus Acidoferrales bacterium]
MKLFSWLKSTVLVTAIIPAPCAWAQFQGQWNFPVVPTNAPPTVQIITPQEGSVFLLGSSFDLCADANYFTNPIASVDFFAGTN